MTETATLKIQGPFYYSDHDENMFFMWLKRVRSFTRIHGELDTLFIEVNMDQFDPEDLREVLALFRRYGVDLATLAVLERDANRTWFRDESKWWYSLVFGGGQLRGAVEPK